MRERAGGPVIAQHEEQYWILEGEKFTRIDCEARATLHFELMDGTKSKVYGPYTNVSFQDGVAYAEREIFAFADRSIVDWYCHSDGLHWPLMVLTAA